MKILITTDLFTVSANGVVTSVKNLFEELRAKNHDVRILTLSDTCYSHRDQAVYFIRSKPLHIYPNVRMPLGFKKLPLVEELIEWKPDIIHTQCEFFSMQFALRISRETGAPIVHTYHTMYEEYSGYLVRGKRFGKWLARIVTVNRLKPVSLVIVPSPKIENLLKGYAIDKPLRIIPSGISLEQHKQRLPSEDRLAKRRDLGIPDDRTALLNLGRLGTEKNLDEVLQFFARLIEAHPSLALLIVGDGPAREQLESLVDSLGIREHVIFTGMVQPFEVHEYYQLGDLFVCASVSETQGLTYIEAAANGLPLLCRKDPCLDSIVRQGVNGYLYETPDEFLDFAGRILGDAAWRARAGKESEMIAAAFDKQAFGDAVEAVYFSVLEEKLPRIAHPAELPAGAGKA